jgi:hypothetical protein
VSGMLFQSWGDVGRVAVVAEGVRTVADNGPSASMGEAMSPPILVTGGTGPLGRHVVPRLRDVGREVQMLTRDSRESKQGVEFVLGDLASGEGLHAAVKHLRSSCTLPAPPWATTSRPGTWSKRLPAGRRPMPAGPLGMAPRPDRPIFLNRGESGPGPGCGPPHLGAVPGSAGGHTSP